MEEVARTIRFNKVLYDALVQWAKEEERTFQGQVIYLLRRAVEQHARDKGEGSE
jgi:hypothetical protein